MLDLAKIVAVLFLVLGAGAYLMRQPVDGTADSGSFTLFKGLESGAKPKTSRPSKADGPDGLVIDHRDGALVVLPWADGGPVEVDATAKQIRSCPLDARYPDCL